MTEDNKTEYDFLVNGFKVKAKYDARDTDDIFIPLCLRLGELQKKAGRRITVYIAGPCGAGKTTLSLFLERLILLHTKISAQAAGIDGFHHRAEYLKSRYTEKNGVKTLLRDIKGAAETYDFDRLYEKISALGRGDVYWPGYERTIHDVVENAGFIEARIVLLEGNWLMLDEAPWDSLASFCDYGIFVFAERETLTERLVERKIMGGLGGDAARAFVKRSDAANIERILLHRTACDLELFMDKSGRFKINNPQLYIPYSAVYEKNVTN